MRKTTGKQCTQKSISKTKKRVHTLNDLSNGASRAYHRTLPAYHHHAFQCTPLKPFI